MVRAPRTNRLISVDGPFNYFWELIYGIHCNGHYGTILEVFKQPKVCTSDDELSIEAKESRTAVYDDLVEYCVIAFGHLDHPVWNPFADGGGNYMHLVYMFFERLCIFSGKKHLKTTGHHLHMNE